MKRISIDVDSGVYNQLREKCGKKSLSIEDMVSNIITTSLGFAEGSFDKDKKFEKLDAIKLIENSILRDLTPNQMRLISEISLLRHFKKDQMVIWDGSLSSYVILIADGTVKVLKYSANGKELVIDVLCRGEIIGIGDLARYFSSYSVGLQSRGETDILMIPKEKFLSIIYPNVKAMSSISSLMNERIDGLINQLTSMVTENADQRVIKTLQKLFKKYGRELMFTHKDIAGMSGTTIETVSRILIKLKKNGDIGLRRNAVILLNNDKLVNSNNG